MITTNSIFQRVALTRRTLVGVLVLLSFCIMTGCTSSKTTEYKGNVASTDSFDSAVDRPPTSKTLYVMARILAGQGRDAEAEYVLVRIIRDDPSYVPAYTAMADIQIRSHKLDDAAKTLTTGLARAPRDAVILNNLGMCRIAHADYAGALDFFNRAAESDPHTPKYTANRAMAMGMMGQYDDSIDVYVQVVSPADAHYNVAVICDARGDKERASDEFAKSDLLRAQEKEGADNPATQPAPPAASATTQAAAPVKATSALPATPADSHTAASIDIGSKGAGK